MEENKEEKPGLQIELDAQTADGVYTNFAMVSHSMSEFVIDAVRIYPGTNKAKVKSRVVMAPEHAKGLMLALQAQLAAYEREFGPLRGEKQQDSKTVPFPINFGSGEA